MYFTGYSSKTFKNKGSAKGRQSISYLGYFGLLPGILWPLASLGTLFEVSFKVLYQTLALFLLHAGMLDGDFQAILLCMVF